MAAGAQEAIATLCCDLCQHLYDTGFVHASRSLDAEGATLHALIEGVALHLTVEPDHPEDAVTLIEAHLDGLAHPAAAAAT